MKPRNRILLAVAAGVAMTTAALAQENLPAPQPDAQQPKPQQPPPGQHPRKGQKPPGVPPGHPGMKPPPFIAVIDHDKNGVISDEEIKKAPEALLTLDRNKDGQLTREELLPPPPQRGPQDFQQVKPCPACGRTGPPPWAGRGPNRGQGGPPPWAGQGKPGPQGGQGGFPPPPPPPHDQPPPPPQQ